MSFSKVQNKLAAYSFVAGSTLAVSLIAKAEIIYTNLDPDTTILNDTYFIDLNNDDINDFEFRNVFNASWQDTTGTGVANKFETIFIRPLC
ncbi:MAG: hypothetical protein HRT71_02640 [Flavobacteriales bacterium]|nr:hypothetical protein [Flavobacteriales bacterium]